jgi:hypothetical protein
MRRNWILVLAVAAAMVVVLLADRCSEQRAPYAITTPVPALPTQTPYYTYVPVPTLTPMPPAGTRAPAGTLLPVPTATQAGAVTALPVPTETRAPAHTPPPPATASPAPRARACTDLVPLGQEATLQIDGTVFAGRVTQVLAGQEAVEMILDGSPLNPLPSKAGKATLIYFVARYVLGPEDRAASMTEQHLDFWGGDGQFWPSPGVILNAPFHGSGFPGAVFEGWLCWYSVVADDPDLLLWKASPVGAREGICFALE